ncbi:hypothetical protein B0H14DRAFT_2594315 [Mycena olivaceomarginata]|nr:hypothetical protein B0H14DRAFT_2594315 [Mycena olivaceomarginata]
MSEEGSPAPVTPHKKRSSNPYLDLEAVESGDSGEEENLDKYETDFIDDGDPDHDDGSPHTTMILDEVVYGIPPGSLGAPLEENAGWDGQIGMDGWMDGQKSRTDGQERVTYKLVMPLLIFVSADPRHSVKMLAAICSVDKMSAMSLAFAYRPRTRVLNDHHHVPAAASDSRQATPDAL